MTHACLDRVEGCVAVMFCYLHFSLLHLNANIANHTVQVLLRCYVVSHLPDIKW